MSSNSDPAPAGGVYADAPRTQDGSLDMRYAQNQGLDKDLTDGKQSEGPSVCKDGTLDMRDPANAGLDKEKDAPKAAGEAYKPPASADGPRCDDGTLDMRYAENAGHQKEEPKKY